MRIRVEPGRCAASGLCVILVPEVFDQAEEDGTVLLRMSQVGAVLHDRITAAAARCPSGAITVAVERTG